MKYCHQNMDANRNSENLKLVTTRNHLNTTVEALLATELHKVVPIGTFSKITCDEMGHLRPVFLGLTPSFHSTKKRATLKQFNAREEDSMTPVFVLPETVVREDGQGLEFPVGNVQGRVLMLTLGITRVLERETLEVAILGSRDGASWQRLAAFPKKSYCGTYSLLLDLAAQPDVRYMRAQWSVSRWDNSTQKPVFSFYVSAEELRARVAGAA